MNNTIQTIIEMDKAAREKLRRAEAEAERITAHKNKKLSNLEQSSASQSEAEIRKECDEIKKLSEKEISRITEEADEKCRRLDSVMKKSSDRMCREIVDRIFRGTALNG